MIKNLSYVFVLAAMFASGVCGAVESATVVSKEEITNSMTLLPGLIKDVNKREYDRLQKLSRKNHAEYLKKRREGIGKIFEEHGLKDNMTPEERRAIRKSARKDIDQFYKTCPSFGEFAGKIPCSARMNLFDLLESSEELKRNTTFVEVRKLIDELNLLGNVEEDTRIHCGSPKVEGLMDPDYIDELNRFFARDDIHVSPYGWIELPADTQKADAYYQKSTGLEVVIGWKMSGPGDYGQRTDKIEFISINRANYDGYGRL